ncbi:MAG TPA: hypothetical protein DCQ28_04950 [Bacteroidetes bacterium]|nr:hypothetical protein [Bacteroidota bacterium]
MNSIIGAYFKTGRIQIAALIYFLIAGALTQVPLFNYLGFEFSALLTIPASFISGILSIQFLRIHQTKPLAQRTWFLIVLDYLRVNLLLLIIPFVIISLNAFAVKNCAYGKGVLYFLLLPVVTTIFSVSLAIVIGVLFKNAKTIFVVVVMAILSHIVFVTYNQSQLFAYNFILGFFPGITYDETSTDLTALAIYREFTLIAAAMLIALFLALIGKYNFRRRISENISSLKKWSKKDRILWGVFIFCLLVLATGHILRDTMGFEFSSADIQEGLGRRSESDHFIIVYHAEDYSAGEMKVLKIESEFHFQRIADVLKTKNADKKKITVYIYPNGTWKQKYIGTNNTNIAKPWKQEIHLTKGTFRSTFRHELVHILASDYGLPLIHASSRMGLNEGLAVAADWDAGIFSPHQFAAALLRENALENVEGLFSLTGFAKQSSTFAYLVSGSFCRYLIDRFGIERFQRVFGNGNFMVHFGESLESLVKDWKAFLKTVDATEIPQETVKALFFQQSIFFKTCPREVADQNQRAIQAMRAKNYTLAENEFSASYANAPTVSALRGLFQSLNSQHKSNHVTEEYSKLPITSSLRTNPAILLILADAYFMNHQKQEALSLYQKIREMNFSESYIEATAIRKQFILDSIDSNIFYSLMYSGLVDSAKLKIIDNISGNQHNSVVMQYLKAIYESSHNDWNAEVLTNLVMETTSNDLKYFALVRAGRRFYELNYFQDAKRSFWNAKNYIPTTTMSKYLEEQIELCDFVSVNME